MTKKSQAIALFALVVSLLIHASGLLILKKGGSGGGEGNEKRDNLVRVTLLDKPSPTESKKPEEKLPENKSQVVMPKKKEVPPEQKVVDHDCKEFYEGIGIQFDGITRGCRVTSIGKGYPAHRADIRVGDLIINEAGGECPGRGPTGTLITLKIMRETQLLTKTLVREKICFSEE